MQSSNRLCVTCNSTSPAWKVTNGTPLAGAEFGQKKIYSSTRLTQLQPLLMNLVIQNTASFNGELWSYLPPRSKHDNNQYQSAPLKTSHLPTTNTLFELLFIATEHLNNRDITPHKAIPSSYSSPQSPTTTCHSFSNSSDRKSVV